MTSITLERMRSVSTGSIYDEGHNYTVLRDWIVTSGTEHRWATQITVMLIFGDKYRIPQSELDHNWVKSGRNNIFSKFYTEDANLLELYARIEEEHANR